MKIKYLVGLLIVAFILSGCYWNKEIDANEIGVEMNAGKIKGCVGPGVHSAWGWFDDLKPISSATVKVTVGDPEVATQDNQLVGVEITIQARRMTDCDSARNILTNWNALVDDQALIDTIDATAREGIKVGTRSFTLTQLLDDRNGLAQKIEDSLVGDADFYSVTIVNVIVNNIAIDPSYAEQLKTKALLTAQIETELRRQDLIKQTASNNILEQERRSAVLQEQVKAEEAQTNVQMEIANRNGKIIAAQNQVYVTNQYAFDLEKLRLMKEILGDKSTFYFIPEGTDITMLWSPNSVVPVPAEPK
jgi:uncharacterized membrane protein YqiK